MTAEDLMGLVGSLGRAAEVVEAIDDPERQRQRGWDLTGWRYELVPWGVRFARRGKDEAEETVLAVMRQSAAREQQLWVVLSGG